MHSFHGKSCNIHHNGDMSGEIIINPHLGGDLEIRIEADDILELVAEHIRRKKNIELESKDWKELLK